MAKNNCKYCAYCNIRQFNRERQYCNNPEVCQQSIIENRYLKSALIVSQKWSVVLCIVNKDVEVNAPYTVEKCVKKTQSKTEKREHLIQYDYERAIKIFEILQEE